MARPEKHDVDYFPFYIKDGRTLFILESKYGCKGTGFFTNVMRFLCATPDHHFQLKDASDRLYFFAKTKCDEESGIDMLNIMANTRKIHTQLWFSGAVIVSEAHLESIKDAYRKRTNPIITIDEIVEKYVSTGLIDVSGGGIADNGGGNSDEQQTTDEKGGNNPQSKVKERKVNNNNPPTPLKISDYQYPDWLNIELWNDFKRMRSQIKKPITTIKTIDGLLKRLKNLIDTGYYQDEIIQKAIDHCWQSFYPPDKKSGNRLQDQNIEAAKQFLERDRHEHTG